ncbi:hypothetical protein [Vermiculatibacterium agrestimuris]|uniref:hypothetical protein n=1 Tax=Vermiculatibacterium agrestimuris TaxID=2941519 RepID=UPI002042554F|nr:hypothetical protein [Vermiculatibacterium agrestimuris]
MIANQFPTSADIYLELNGKKLAVVQSYSAQTTKTSSVVEAFGESEPVATIPGPRKHTVVLTRLYATEEAAKGGMSFHELEDFNLVICKPDRRIIYSGCQWQDLSETGKLGDMVLEKVTIVAARRVETALR